MGNRLAVIGIIVEAKDNVGDVNKILSEYADYIIGRMGIPHKERGVSIISVVIDAPSDLISALSGKLGKLKGISSKVVYSKL